MDPVTHTMVGAVVATAGWRRRTALAVPAAIIAANIPDVDIITMEAGDYASLALRRGWTHGPPAIVVGALLAFGLVVLWDRFVRRRRDPASDPVRAGPLLVLVGIAAITHPLLDWMNTYGIRILMPFDRRWYYGDSLFIIDPWLWLMLGVPLFLMYSRTTRAIVAWSALALAASMIVVATGIVPTAAKIVWLLPIGSAAALRALRGRGAGFGGEALGRAGVAISLVYIGGMVGSSAMASRAVARAAVDAGIDAQRIMVAPAPANPLRAGVVIADGSRYWLGEFGWLASPRVALNPEPVAAGEFDAVARAAAAHPNARDFLVWSRFPIIDVQPDGAGHVVRFGDARYVDGPGTAMLGGVSIRLNSALQPVD